MSLVTFLELPHYAVGVGEVEYPNGMHEAGDSIVSKAKQNCNRVIMLPLCVFSGQIQLEHDQVSM